MTREEAYERLTKVFRDVFDDEDIWVVKKESVDYKPLPSFPDMSLNTYIE